MQTEHAVCWGKEFSLAGEAEVAGGGGVGGGRCCGRFCHNK